MKANTSRKKAFVRHPKKKTIAAKKKNAISYDEDFYKWSKSQAILLKKGDFEKLDILNLTEEIESLGRSDKRALRNHLTNLFLHLLKQKYQPKLETYSWVNSIRNAKWEIESIIEDSPSLKRFLPEFAERAYTLARIHAAEETRLAESTFPVDCPWGITDILK